MSEIKKREITQELTESYLDYAMSVIVSRALPDIRDGLKPVHRRVLWAMWDSGNTAQSKFRKSANVVGETMGKYHPHGDSSIYDTLVRLAQDFSLRYPLVQGQGNFGSIDGDSAAAMRYCVTGSTLVLTDTGLQAIEKIVGEGSGSGEEEIKLKVLSKDKKIHSASKWFDSGEHPTLKITTGHGYALQGTTNHPVLVWRCAADGQPTFSWKLMEEIQIGDVMVIDRTPDLLWPTKKIVLKGFEPELSPRATAKVLPEHLNADLAFILGALVAEGTIKEKELEFCNSDIEWIEELSRIWQGIFPDCRLHRFRHKPNSFGRKPYETLEIHSQAVVRFLKNIGLAAVKSKEKTIPDLILKSPKAVAAAFLRAYFEGDGSISFSGRMTELSCISVSEEMIVRLQVLLLRFGIASTRRFDKYRGTHKLYIRGLGNYRLFQEQIGFWSARKRAKLEEAIRRLHKNYLQTDYVPFLASFVRGQDYGNTFVTRYNFDRYPNLVRNKGRLIATLPKSAQKSTEGLLRDILANNYLFDPVTAIEDGGMRRVYSLKVESDCHSFVANGFINHNTEAKLARVSEEMLGDIDKETVDWSPNYDATREEPRVLPAKLPNLLLNGSLGIAVGMATSIPPHNLKEVAAAILHLADHPDATVGDMMEFIQGPDFPTGGVIFDQKAIREAYATGRGGIVCRAKVDVEERKAKQFDLIVTEIPYQVNKAEMIKRIAELVQEKKLEGIRDLRDESDREGLRVVIELKNDVPPQKILNQLYKYTDLQKDFHLNMIALVNGIEPRLLSVKDILAAYLDYRKIVVRRRTEFDLKRAEERAHILEGLAIALGSIDKVIATIKKSKSREEAHVNLRKNFKLSDIQATAILEMRLQNLAALERQKIEDELKEKKALIKELQLILKSPARMLTIIKDELTALTEKYGDERRTQVVPTGLGEFKEEDLIPQEEAIITLSAGGYIKRLPPGTFKIQGRGGKGLIGSDVAEEDFLTHFLAGKTHDNLLFFTNRGRVFQTKVHEIPPGSRTSKGRGIHNFLEMPTDEEVSAIIAYGNDKKSQGSSLIMVTTEGIVKRTPLEDFKNIRRTGIIAIALKKGDSLKDVRLSAGKSQVIITTTQGQSIRFKEAQVRSMGRTAAGIHGIRLRKGDKVAGFDIIQENEKEKGKEGRLLVVMANGFGKQTPLKEYKTQNRGGSGIRTANITAKTGALIAAKIVTDETEILTLSAKGQVIRTALLSVRATGRAAQGVRIMNLKAGDRLAGLVVI